jgi:hypothetical protein
VFVVIRRPAKTDDVGHAHLGALDLALLALAAEVRGHLVDAGNAGGRDRVALRLEAAAHVHRHVAVAPTAPGTHEVQRTAGLAQPEVVVVNQFGRREAVVQFH